MKTFALLALLSSISLNAFGSSAHHWGSTQLKPAKKSLYSFSVDNRPADGNFESIKVQKNESGTYEASLQVITAGFGFPVSDTTTELGFNLDCKERKRGHRLLALECSHDNRPADGALVVLKLVRSGEGTYDATLRQATYATLQAPATDETTEIAFGLSLDR